MKATIFHNPMCGTSRKTLDILRDSGCDVWIQEYLKNPPTRDELVRLYQRAGLTPREGLRAKEALADELGLNSPEATDDQILDAMIDRCRELKLRAPGNERQLVMDFTVLLTAKTVHSHYSPSRREWFAL